MMYLLKHRPLAVLIGGLLVFSACKKDSDAGSAPVVDPISVAAVKPNDTLTLKGQNFSATAAGNVVKIGDVEVVVVSATATEIKVVIPDTVTPGTYTITITANGKTTSAGTIAVNPLTYYMIKGVFTNGSEYQLIAINSETLNESLVVSLGKDRINNVIYFPATNEIMGVDDNGAKLVKINVTTKQVTSVTLPASATSGTAQLVADKSNNLYGITYDWSGGAMQTQTLAKIDPATGSTTAIKKFTEDDDWVEPVYLAATNEIVGLMNDGKRLFKVNLTTKDTLGINLPGSTSAQYRELIVDNNSNLFAYKARLKGDINDVAKLVTVSAVTGQETVLKNLAVDGKFDDKIIIAPQLDGFIGTWNQNTLYRINVSSFELSSRTLTTGNSYTYNYFTSN